ncbi:MAG TPA: hypothetical protein VIK10_10325 [Prolixibacteraceae bacterium]
MNYFVEIPVKSYVKRFIDNNYGDPVNFSRHPRERELFMRMLKKPANYNDHKYPNDSVRLCRTVEVPISDRDFYRHGWELSKTDIVSFGKHFERNAKWLMRSVVGTYISFGTPIQDAIQKFQLRFNMEEEYWPFDSIKKDFFRFRLDNAIDYNQFAFQHLERLILCNMCDAGAMTQKAILYHENMTVIST